MPRPPILPIVDWSSLLERGFDWEAWLALDEMPEHCERMRKIFDELVIPAPTAAFLAALTRKVNVIAIAEDWCGDVIRHAPTMAKIAATSDKITLRFVKREDSPQTFVRFLTNGGEAIPKFVFLSQDFVECGSWGPMPAAHREVIARGKACGDVAAARKRVKKLYESDPGQVTVIEELTHLVEITACEVP